MRDHRGALLIGKAAEVREMDRRAIEDVGISGLTLMESAGAGTARLILERKGFSPQKAVVLCGTGNNGGDGYVVARHLVDAGWTDVVCVAVGSGDRMAPDAAFNERLWREVCRGEVLRPDASGLPDRIQRADVIVDGLFGTGLSRPLGPEHAHLVDLANTSRGFRVALDLPSGVVADTGELFEPSFKADLTTTYAVSKFGLHQFPGAMACGEVQVVKIGLPRAIVESVGTCGRGIDQHAAVGLLPNRPPDGHKGTFGHVGIVGGARGMEGAALLSALGALRVGCGLATWNRPDRETFADVEVTRPAEVMVHDITSTGGIDARSRVIVVGPGLGREPRDAALLKTVMRSGRPMVIDADALHLLSNMSSDDVRGTEVVLTPHPAEAAKLLGVGVKEIQADRPSAAEALVERYGAVVVLKGASTLIGAAHSPLSVIDGGQPALAVAGSGDVLAGMCAGLLGQGLSAFEAAQLAVYIHARAGDRVAELGAGRGALAHEIARAGRDVLADLEAARAWV